MGLFKLRGRKEEGEAGEKPSSQDSEQAQEAKEAVSEEDEDAEKEYPPFRVVALSWLSLNLAFFLVALDRTIIGVAIPRISDEFKSFGEISWYESAFFLTSCAFQLPMGRIYTFYPPKWVFLVTVVIFEVGSTLCAAAPNSTAFIIGRAIAGAAGAGTMSGATTILADLVPVNKRPSYQGLLGAVFGISSIAGPLLGGVFTSKLSWRWCFWINLPVGGVAFVVLLLFLPYNPPRQERKKTFLGKIGQLDPIGTVLLIPAIVCLVLALQWGGAEYPWSNWRVIVLLVIGSVLLLAFMVLQVWEGEKATIPPRIICQRSIAAAFVGCLCLGSVLVVVSFYLPIWFQVVKGDSAVEAGIKLLPYFLSTVVFVIGSGFGVTQVGYYTPFMIIGSAIAIVGLGLLTTFGLDTGHPKWIGFQVIIGAGVGTALQQPMNAANTVLHNNDIPTGMAFLGFAQGLGGAIFIAACQTLLLNSLQSSLSDKISGFDPSLIATSGATQIRKLVPPSKLLLVLKAYDNAMDQVFYFGMALAIGALVSSFFLEWRTVKK